MDKRKLRDAMKSITAAVGRKTPSGAGVEKRRVKIEAALTAGSRTTKRGKVVQFSAARTAELAAKMIALGGTVPEVARERYPFSHAIPALRAIAEAVGCDPDALVSALVPPAPVEVSVGLRVVEAADAAAPRTARRR